MNLSPAQVQRFWREWAATCKARNWTREAGLTASQIDAHRKDLLAACGFNSLTQVDRTDGFTKVLHETIALRGDSLKSAMETVDAALNQARVLRNQILTEIIPCLELYRREELAEDLAKIMEDKNRWWKLDRPSRGMTLMDLDARPIFRTDRATGGQKYMGSQLSQMQWTLSRWLNDLRNEAGDTIHDMRTRAGVPCTCAICRGTRVAASGGDPELESKAGADPELGDAVCLESNCAF